MPVAFRLDYNGILALGYDAEKNAVAITACDHNDEPITLFLRPHEITEIITALETEKKYIKPRNMVV